MGVTKQTELIILELKNGTSDMSPLDWGFRAALARKYGISRQRISNIAKSIGLAADTRKKRVRLITKGYRKRGDLN